MIHDCKHTERSHTLEHRPTGVPYVTDKVARAALSTPLSPAKKSFSPTAPAECTGVDALRETYLPAGPPPLSDLMRGEAARQPTSVAPLASFLEEENAEFSAATGEKVTNVDIIRLCYLLYAMEVESQEGERSSRMADRADFIKQNLEMVANFKEQGNWSLATKVGAGVMAIIAGIAPIALQNNWLWEKFANNFDSIKKLTQQKFAVQAGKILSAMAELQKHTGEIHNTFADGRKHSSQYKSELARTDSDEATRRMEDVKRHFQDLAGMLLEEMRNADATARALYH